MQTPTRESAVTRVWRPYPAQERFMSCSAFEAFFGGSAYPGKTESLLMEGLRQIDNARYNAIFFRRTYTMLEGADGPIARSKLWFPGFGGIYSESKHVWTFPSGARYFFRHLENIKDLDNYQGDQYQYIAFDELPQFLEQMYLYLFSRCRTDDDTGLRCYIRAGGNPGGYAWVKRRFIRTGINNRIGYFKRVDDLDVSTTRDDPDAKSRTFIPASYRDNPNTTREYIASLNQMSKVDKARLADGDWEIEDDSDRIYPDWSSLENVTTDAEYNPDFGSVYWAVDDGYAYGRGKGTDSYHPRVILFFQKTPIGGVNFFRERYATGEADYNLTINDVLGTDDEPKNEHLRPVIAYIDSSAAMFKGALMKRGITCSGATHPVAEGLRNMRRLVCDANGMRLLKAHPRCVEFNEEMATYRYDNTSFASGVGDRKPAKVDDHGPDGARYGTWNMRHMFGRGQDD